MAAGTAARPLGVTSHRGCPHLQQAQPPLRAAWGVCPQPSPGSQGEQRRLTGHKQGICGQSSLPHRTGHCVPPPCPRGRPGFLAGRRATCEAPGEGRCEQVVLGQERHLESREQRADLDTDLTPSTKPAENGTLNKKTQQRKTSRRKHRREIYVNFHLVICY